MTETEHQFDLALAECEAENRLLRARNERLENRQWNGLTDNERTHSASPELWMYLTEKQKQDFIVYARDIEAKLKERNT